MVLLFNNEQQRSCYEPRGREERVELRFYLDGDHEFAVVFQELCSVESEDSCLIGLSDISEDDVDHTNNHSVTKWVTSVFNDWHNICSLLSDTNQISS